MKIIALIVTTLITSTLITCIAINNENNSPAHKTSLDMVEYEMPGGKTVLLATRPDKRTVYNSIKTKNNCHIVVSKKELRLYVYENEQLVAHYPICLGLNFGNKICEGDMKTPECSADKPFHISEIKYSAQWKHDFGDGRGYINAYGQWFLRLKTGHKGIAIHGSTNNEITVPGRASEGCIRLRDNDICHLKENYAFVGMKVIILGENE